MKEVFELSVHVAFDEESGMWYIAESDIPGLCLEDSDPLALLAKVEQAAPELFALNENEIRETCKRIHPEAFLNHVQEAKSPAIKPVFDSPMRFAHA